MQTFIVVSVSAVTVREGTVLLQCDVLRIITLHTHCQLRTMEGREYKSGPILIFKFKHKRTLSMYVGTVYCRLAIIKCRENIEKNKQSFIEYGDENIQFRVPEMIETERRGTEIFISCLKMKSRDTFQIVRDTQIPLYLATWSTAQHMRADNCSVQTYLAFYCRTQ